MESRKLKENSVDSVDTSPPVCPVQEKPTDHSSSERTLACCDRIDLRLLVWSWPTAAKGMEQNDSSTDRRNQTQAHADADAKATEDSAATSTVLSPALRGIKPSKLSKLSALQCFRQQCFRGIMQAALPDWTASGIHTASSTVRPTQIALRPSCTACATAQWADLCVGLAALDLRHKLADILQKPVVRVNEHNHLRARLSHSVCAGGVRN